MLAYPTSAPVQGNCWGFQDQKKTQLFLYHIYWEKKIYILWKRKEEALTPKSQVINSYIPRQELSRGGLQGHPGSPWQCCISHPFAEVNTFCKAQSTFKAQDKILTVLLISAKSGSFCDGHEGLGEGP